MRVSDLMRRVLVPATLACLASGSVLASPLYITDFDTSVTDLSQNPWGVSVLDRGGSTLDATASWRHGLIGTENRQTTRGPIAVAGGRIDVAGPFTRAYDLAGNLLSSEICPDCGYLASSPLYDGTTDGTFNYTVGTSIGTSLSPSIPGVWRTDRNWQNAVFFSLVSIAKSGEEFTGITYDRARQSLWLLGSGVSGFSSTPRIVETSLAFQIKSEFSALNTGRAGALAMDYQDDSLWYVPLGGGADQGPTRRGISHFSVNGDYLDFVAFDANYSGVRESNGAEFELPGAAVPAPATLALFALGLAGLGFSRRKSAQV